MVSILSKKGAAASRASGSELRPVVNIVGRSLEATILLPVSGRELGKLSAVVEATLDPTTNFNLRFSHGSIRKGVVASRASGRELGKLSAVLWKQRSIPTFSSPCRELPHKRQPILAMALFSFLFLVPPLISILHKI